MTKLKIHSNYWKIDNSENIDSSIKPSNTSFSKDGDTIAISSNYLNENLKVFQLIANSLIHVASITLPDVQSLKFLNPVDPTTQSDFKFLLSGHSNGIIHLSAIPLIENNFFENAEIIKRFNHKKHLKLLYNNNFERKSFTLNNGNISTSITSIDLVKSHPCSLFNSMVTVYDHHLFYWDTTKSKNPLSIIRTNGITAAKINNKADSLTAIVGDFGLSLLDLRSGKNKSKNSSYFPPSTNKRLRGFTQCEWSNLNENYISTIQADENIVQLWDLRKLDPITSLSGFRNKISSIMWDDNNTIWAGDYDGYLSKWCLNDLSSYENTECILNNNNNNGNNNTDLFDDYRFDKRSKTGILKVGSNFKISDSKIISLDNSSDNNQNSILCLDDSYLSLHVINKPNKLTPMERIFLTNEILDNNGSSNISPNSKANPITKPYDRVPSYVSNYSTYSDLSIPLFDKNPITNDENRRSSETSIAESSYKNVTGDYPVNYETEINTMLKKANTKTINNIVYL